MKKLIIAICLFIFMSCSENIENYSKENRIFRTGDKYFVYYNEVFFEMPKDLYLTKNKTIEQYFTKGMLRDLDIEVLNKAELLNDLNKYFPDGIQYITAKEKIDMKQLEVPILNVGVQKHIDSIKFEKLLTNLDNVKKILLERRESEIIIKNEKLKPEETLKGKKIEILNASKVEELAQKYGVKLKEKFGIEYNVENYTNPEMINYVIVRKFSEIEIQAIINELGLKYIKVLQDNTIKPDADFVLIVGDENKAKFNIEIVTLGDSSEISQKLVDYNKKIIKSTEYSGENIENLESVKIIYNKNDIYTAKIISKKIEKDVKLIENNMLNNKIIIVSKN